jgi:oligoendopeptidase F
VLAAYLSGATFERHYSSSLALMLSDDPMPEARFHTLMAETDKALPAIHRYLQVRKRMLGVDQVHIYDLYFPLVPRSAPLSVG